MKKRFLALLLLPLIISGCQGANKETTESGTFDTHTVDHPRKVGEIGNFSLLTPEDGFVADSGFTFTWEEANNADLYQIEIASTLSFVTDDSEEVYVRENNLANPRYTLNFNLPKKDIEYYWRVTASNADHTKKSEIGKFFCASPKDELPIKIEDEQDWILHKDGSYADISINRNDFFGTGNDSLVIKFDKEHTLQNIPKSDGWIVITKYEDRALDGTDAFYFNFYYSGHDSTVLIRVLDNDGEYWHKQVQISNNSKQTVIMKYDDFELRTVGGNVFNRKFDWQHITAFEIVFERTFGDGVCVFSDIKAVKFDNYKFMFVDKMDFNSTNMSEWTYENYNFTKTISEDGNEITIEYVGSEMKGGYGFQNANVYKLLVEGDALRMKVKYTGSSNNAIFYFRVLEEDNDRWQFKVDFKYFIKDEYKELVIPFKAFQRTDYMAGDGAKQFAFVQKFNFGLASNYASGSISIKDLEVIKLSSIVESSKRTVGSDGCIEDFNNYEIYTQIYYYWEQSVENKDEAMKLDTVHKAGGLKNKYCAEFDYKADMEQAVYQLYLNTENVDINKNAFSIWLKDASVKFDDPAVAYIKEENVAAEMTIQLTMDSGEWYRYTIKKVLKEWNIYTILFSDFELFNGDDLFDDPQPLSVDHIVHMAFGFKYLYYDAQGNHHPTYAIANPVYLDEIYFTNATETTIEEMNTTIKEDEDNPGVITVETMEEYMSNDDISAFWSYGIELDYNSMVTSDDVSSLGGNKSMKMHYKGSVSVSYGRVTQFANSVTAKGICLDIKGDGKATVYLNLNWRKGTTLFKMRHAITNIPTTWTHYELGFDINIFKDVGGTQNYISANNAKNIESISFGIVNNDYSESDIYIDNIRLLKNIDYTTNTSSAIV